ncbi:MAG: hypothetical protein IPN96_10585 [Anaerolineales bacterium]|nr:hypothetical protein [Anaerolineales bacterium]
MKTQIITLESHDDLISVRDKLSWAKTPRILLVWPKYEKVTLRVLDLKVLQRHADSLGAQLGLVTRRANVRRDANRLAFRSSSRPQRLNANCGLILLREAGASRKCPAVTCGRSAMTCTQRKLAGALRCSAGC